MISVFHSSKFPRKITGRFVFICIAAFFAVVVAANAIMIRFALSTFSGVETENAYRAGLAFSNELAAARSQESRHWQIDARILAQGSDGATIEILPKDDGGRILVGLDFDVLLAHPTDRRKDRVVIITEHPAGFYRGAADIQSGQWDIVLDINKNGERLFRSKNRVQIR